MKKYNWEKEFDEEFLLLIPLASLVPTKERHKLIREIKSFIRQLLAQEEANWMAEIHEQLKTHRHKFKTIQGTNYYIKRCEICGTIYAEEKNKKDKGTASPRASR